MQVLHLEVASCFVIYIAVTFDKLNGKVQCITQFANLFKNSKKYSMYAIAVSISIKEKYSINYW